MQPGNRLTFVVCVLATAAIVWGANAAWVGDNGFELDGTSDAIRTAVPVDPFWLYAAAGVSAFGLLLVLLFGARRAYALCAAGALGVGVILAADIPDLLDIIDASALTTGVYVTGGAALILMASSLRALSLGGSQ